VEMMKKPVEIGTIKALEYYYNQQFTPEIPPISDLITMVVREVIPPERFYVEMPKKGFSAEWARNYWEMHWILPAFGSVREAMWRKIISEDEYRKYVVWHDYKPEPRPGIAKSDQEIMFELSFELPGRIDVRWMAEWAVIDYLMHLQLTRMRGIHPDWAPKVVEAERINVFREHYDRIRSVLIRRYREGFISAEDLSARLMALHYPPEAVALQLQHAAEEFDLDWRMDLKKEYDRLALKRKIDLEEYAFHLRELGMTSERISFEVRRIQTKIWAAEKEAS